MEGLGKYKNFIAACILIGLFAWGAKKLFTDYQVQQRQLQEHKQTLVTGKELMERWDKAVGEYRMSAHKFFQQDPALFKRFVEDTAQSNSVTINSSSITKEEKGQFLYVKLSVKSQSSYRNFTHFIKAIEEKMVSVERAIIQKRPQGGVEQDIVIQGFVVQ